ncbi:MAG: DUF3784 domain-containing protein [Bacillota bacterium]
MEFIFPISMGFTVLLLIGLGILVKYYKAYWLISGYNTMSKEKKEKVDVEGLAKFTGNVCFVMGALMLLATVMIMIGQEVLGGIVFAAFIPLSIYLIVKSQKYDGNTKNPDGTMTKKSKMIVGGISAFLLLTAIGIGVLLYYSNKPPVYVIENETFQIQGLYGEKIPIEEISEVSLKNSLPKIISRTNGSSLGSKKKGHFRLESLGKAKLFLDTTKPPFIYLKKNDTLIIFNCNESEETAELFHDLQLITN